MLAGLYASVTARIRRARYVTPMTPQRWALAVKEHEAILNALQRRDGVGLSHILRAHLRHKREEVLQAGFAETEGEQPRCGLRDGQGPVSISSGTAACHFRPPRKRSIGRSASISGMRSRAWTSGHHG